MSEHYPDGHNLGPGAVYDTPDEKEIARLERKVKGLQMALAASDASLNEYIEKTKAAEAALRSARPEAARILPAEVQTAYDKANESACCGCTQTVQYGHDDMEQVCCGSPVPLCMVDEATAHELGVAVYKHWDALFAPSPLRQKP